MKRQLPVLLLVLAVLIAGTVLLNRGRLDVPEELSGIVVDKPRKLAKVELIDHKLDKVDASRFTGNWTFVFFGFTHCPDICPATLQQLTRVKQAVAELEEPVPPMQVFFVSVDPERDTADHLSKYVPYFDGSFLGVTGDRESIVDFERQLGGFHRVEDKDAHGNYLVTHSSEIFLVGPDTQLVAKFEPPMTPVEVARQYASLADWYGKGIN